MWKLKFSRRDKIRTCGLRSAPVGPGRGPPDLVGLRSAPVGPGRGPPDLVGLRSAPVGPGRGPPDLVDPLRPNGVFSPIKVTGSIR